MFRKSVKFSTLDTPSKPHSHLLSTMAFKLQACSNSVGQIASLATSVKDATNTTTSEDFLIGVDPLLVRGDRRARLWLGFWRSAMCRVSASLPKHAPQRRLARATRLRVGVGARMCAVRPQIRVCFHAWQTALRRSAHLSGLLSYARGISLVPSALRSAFSRARLESARLFTRRLARVSASSF